MGFLKKWIEGSKGPEKGESKARREEILVRLDELGGDAPEAANLYNRLADLELADGSQQLAQRYYGRSIDLYVEQRQFDSATAICRKLLRLLPGVVRARCTLAWLSLRKGHLDVAREQIDEYVRAATQAGTTELAAQQLRLMAQYASSSELRSHISERLRDIGDGDGADEIEKAGTAGFSDDTGSSWDPVVFATLLTPEELKEAEEKGLEIRSSPAQDDSLPFYAPEA